jgi:uncharacterized membrane protein YbhN (UPF0104 family)
MTPKRAAGWLPWLIGAAAVGALVYVAQHVAEERAFVDLLKQARPVWMIGALVLQAATYLAQAGVWRVVLQRAHCQVSLGYAWRLSLAKLFVDQAVPSMGVSGAALVARSLEARAVPRAAVMSSVAVDAASFYIAYVIDLAIALALLAAEGRAHPLIVAIIILFLVYGGTLATACGFRPRAIPMDGQAAKTPGARTSRRCPAGSESVACP